MSKWQEIAKVKEEGEVDLAYLILQSRGYSKNQIDKFLNPDYSLHLHDPFALNDMDKAVKRIKKAISQKEKIVIYGDYDIDGMTATALLLDGLKSFGLNTSYYIPDRFEEGYGLNDNAIKNFKKDGIDLIITVDCGIGAEKQIALAKKLNIDVIVTDHHNLANKLPKDAIAIVNPKIGGYPFDQLAGVGVAFKLIQAMQQKLEGLNPGQEKWLLDLVALGTICDSVDLLDENRVLTTFGLKVLKMTKRVGLIELASSVNIDPLTIDAHKIGFVFGPRLNAAGRLEHAKKALNLLMTENRDEAKEISAKLNQLNSDRQKETSRIYTQAIELIKKHSQDNIFVLADKSWSHGIVGIVASRIAQKYLRPAIILQIEGKTAKGSARSFGQFSIIDALDHTKKHLIQYGGHRFAAGLKVQTSKINEFTKSINKYADKKQEDFSQGRDQVSCLGLAGGLISLDSFYQLSKLEPFGVANQKPFIMSRLKLLSKRSVGQDQAHLQMSFTDSKDNFIRAIAFNKAQDFDDLAINNNYNIVCRLDNNIYNQHESVQIEIIDIFS